jgi:glycosyltransferase involved in cell wall biosynthesis
MKNKILFSIIIATKNPSNDLLKTIASVRSQSLKDYEIVIVDSNSEYPWDKYFGELKSFVNIFVSEPDSGIYDAWNKGIKLSGGKWILFLGEGDLLYNNNVLKYYTEVINNQKDSEYIYGDILISEVNNLVRKPWKSVSDKIRSEMPIPHVGMLHNRILFEKHGFFNTDFKICGDYEFFIRTCNAEKIIYIENFITVKMKPGGVSANPSYSLKIVKENYMANALNGKKLPSFKFLVNSVIYLGRYIKNAAR